MTPEEFDAADDFDENYNYELIHGVLVVSPISARSERSPNELLGHWLLTYQEQHPQGRALVATFFEDYIRTKHSRRRADRLIWTEIKGRRPDPSVDVAAIAAEFVSSGKAAWRRDYIEKQEEYLAAGIVQYWVVDRFQRMMTVFTLRDGKPHELVVKDGEVYRTDLLPGFELRLAELLAAADKWSEST
jgi:Uma2 family endonuclease